MTCLGLSCVLAADADKAPVGNIHSFNGGVNFATALVLGYALVKENAAFLTPVAVPTVVAVGRKFRCLVARWVDKLAPKVSAPNAVEAPGHLRLLGGLDVGTGRRNGSAGRRNVRTGRRRRGRRGWGTLGHKPVRGTKRCRSVAKSIHKIPHIERVVARCPTRCRGRGLNARRVLNVSEGKTDVLELFLVAAFVGMVNHSKLLVSLLHVVKRRADTQAKRLVVLS
jgi:hypothetical protein